MDTGCGRDVRDASPSVSRRQSLPGRVTAADASGAPTRVTCRHLDMIRDAVGVKAWGQFKFSCQAFCKYECATSQGSEYTTCVKNCQYCNSGGVNLPPCCPSAAFCFGSTPCCQACGPYCCSP